MARVGSRCAVVRFRRLAVALVAVIAGTLGACSATASAQLPAIGTLLKPTVTSVGTPTGWVATADISVSISAHGSLLGIAFVWRPNGTPVAPVLDATEIAPSAHDCSSST